MQRELNTPHGESMTDYFQTVTTLEIGEGSIDPQTRVEAGEITTDEIEAFVADIESSDFDTDVPEAAPSCCVDGRCKKIGLCAAGGSFSVVMGDALTNGRFMDENDTDATHAVKVYYALTELEQPVGVHDDDHAADDNCGCGAEDKLDNVGKENQPSILKFIAENGDKIQNTLASLGVVVDDATNSMIKNNAAKLREGKYATNGKNLKEAAEQVAGEEAVAHLEGTHNEVALRINRRPGKTLDRERLAEKYGPKLMAFELDVPALEQGAKYTSMSADETQEKVIAMLYYNVATASVLAGRSLVIAVAK